MSVTLLNKISAIDELLTSQDLSQEHRCYLQQYKKTLQLKVDAKNKFKQLKPFLVPAGVGTIFGAGMLGLLVIFSAPKSDVPPGAVKVPTAEELAELKQTKASTKEALELPSAFTNHLEYQRSRLDWAQVATIEKELAALSEEDLRHAKILVDNIFRTNSSLYDIAHISGELLAKQEKYSPETGLFVAQSILIERKMATSAVFSQY